MNRAEYSEAEVAALNAALDTVSARAQHRISLNDLIRRWENFVKQVEVGYRDNLYEYMDSLSVRDILEEVIDSVPGRLQEMIRQRVSLWDSRFAATTRPTQASIAGGQKERDSVSRFWFRVPVILEGELREGIQPPRDS